MQDKCPTTVPNIDFKLNVSMFWAKQSNVQTYVQGLLVAHRCSRDWTRVSGCKTSALIPTPSLHPNEFEHRGWNPSKDEPVFLELICRILSALRMSKACKENSLCEVSYNFRLPVPSTAPWAHIGDRPCCPIELVSMPPKWCNQAGRLVQRVSLPDTAA